LTVLRSTAMSAQIQSEKRKQNLEQSKTTIKKPKNAALKLV